MNWLLLLKYWREGVVIAAILAAFLYRDALIDERSAFTEYKITQKALVNARAKQNAKLLKEDKAQQRKLKDEKKRILEHLNNVINENVEQGNIIDSQRASIERLREYITASFSGRHRAATAAKDGADTNGLSNRDFQRFVRDCTETSLMLKAGNQWIKGTCKRDGITCEKGGE